MWLAIVIIIVAVLSYAINHANSRDPLGLAVSVAPIYALVTFLVLSAISRLQRNPTSNKDCVRIFCWTFFAFSLGINKAPYYEVFFPQHWYVKEVVSIEAMILSLLGIVLSTFLMQQQPLTETATLCLECEYDLRGSTDTGRCPECGTPFSKT